MNKELEFEISNKARLLLKQAEDGLFQPRLLDALIDETSEIEQYYPIFDFLLKFKAEMISRGYYKNDPDSI